jgi:solute:Na+ symporter, SSS family
MITQLLPHGLIGVLIAALLAGLMSNVAAALNSISTIVSYDLFKRIYPLASDWQVVMAGRFSAIIALFIGIATMWPASNYASIFNGLNDVIAHIAPPITCVFLFGIFWGRASGFAAQWTLWLGSGMGIGVFAVNKLIPGNPLASIPFMLMAFWLFCACSLVMTVLTVAVPHQHTAVSRELYWKSPLDPLRAPCWPGWANYRILAMGLLLVMGLLYWIFR